MKRSSSPSHQDIPPCLVSILTQAFEDTPRVFDLFHNFFCHPNYCRDFVSQLFDIAKGNAEADWSVRRLAIAMLQYQMLQLSPIATAECDFVLTQLHLKQPDTEQQTVSYAVLKEGYSTTTLYGFFQELQRNLARFQHVYAQLKGTKTSPHGLQEFIHLSQRDCCLALARYLFTPQEVVDYILSQVRVSEGMRDRFRFLYATDEAEYQLSILPAFEYAILKKLRDTSQTYWVSDRTSSELNALVEYPLQTVVLVLKLPGSCLEFELKRAGRPSRHPLSVVYQRDGRPVPPPHRLDGGSMGPALQWEAGHSALVANVYRLVHHIQAPTSHMLSITLKSSVPVEDGDELLANYLSKPDVFGEGFHDIQSAMKQSIAAFQEEKGSDVSDFSGDMGLSLQFISQTAPSQAILAGSSAFRLDTVSRYLSHEGPRLYFTEGLQRTYTPQEARQFADVILTEVLGVYTPPQVAYHDHPQYVAAALAVPANRARADDTFVSLLEQMGTFWGTLLAIRGHSWGESFVARNVGLKSVWQKGQWQVKIIFMDHDNMRLVPKHIEHFSPEEIVRGMLIDESYIIRRAQKGARLVSEVDYLENIYQLGEAEIQRGQRWVRRAIARAYHTTHAAMQHNARLQKFFSPVFVERLQDWDAVVATVLKAQNTTPKPEAWKRKVYAFLRQKGYPKEVIQEYITTAGQEQLRERLSFLYDSSAGI